MDKRVWGVDTASKGIAIGMLHPDDSISYEWIQGLNNGRVGGWEKANFLRKEFRTFVQKEIAEGRSPDAVFIESPVLVGSRATVIELSMVVAAVRIILEEFLLTHFEANISHWKKEIIGKGNASKDEIKAFVLLSDDRIADNLREDVYDAFAIAKYGRNKIRKAGR